MVASIRRPAAGSALSGGRVGRVGEHVARRGDLDDLDGGLGWLGVLSLTGAHAAGVGKYRQQHCGEQHREPSQGAEAHVRDGRCGPTDPRSVGRQSSEGSGAFTRVGRVPAS